jgi:hypothetical protein
VKITLSTIAKIAGDPTQGARTWVLLTETAEGGWGIAGTAFGGEEFRWPALPQPPFGLRQGIMAECVFHRKRDRSRAAS